MDVPERVARVPEHIYGHDAAAEEAVEVEGDLAVAREPKVGLQLTEAAPRSLGAIGPPWMRRHRRHCRPPAVLQCLFLRLPPQRCCSATQ